MRGFSVMKVTNLFNSVLPSLRSSTLDTLNEYFLGVIALANALVYPET